MVLVQKWDFFHLFILGKIGRKNAFLDYKNKKLKNKKIGLFLKGLVHGFALKMGFFHLSIFGKIGKKKSLAIF